jgi:hypothetical protein
VRAFARILFGLGLVLSARYSVLSGLVYAGEKNDERTSLIIVAGAGGEKEYDEAFARWAANWRKAGEAGDSHITIIGLAPDEKDSLARIRAALQAEQTDGLAPLWLVLLGHGTFDGHDAKFNLRGDDLTAGDLATLLKPFQRPVVVIAAFSSSGAFLAPLSAPGRIIVTATKTGAETNFARLGKYLSETIADPSADLDHDGQTSLLEAWLAAAQRVADFYKSEGRLATEHSLLDDNGDKLGTPADWFRGIRVVKKSKDATPDGPRAHQMHLVPSRDERELPPQLRADRDALELELSRLRETKSSMPEDQYYAKLEAILLRLARLYRDGKQNGKGVAP